MWRSSRRLAPLAAAAIAPLSQSPARTELKHVDRLESTIKRRDSPTAPTSALLRRNIVSDEHRRDELIQWLKEMLHHSFVLDMPETYDETWQTFEQLIEEHRAMCGQGRSHLQEVVPTLGVFHTPLPTTRAWRAYDAKYSTSKRKYVTPTFHEIRHTLNLAQVMAVEDQVEIISFDGDQTLYSDGQNFKNDSLAALMIALLRDGVNIVVMTAAGYAWDGPKYEYRLAGLLKHFKANLTAEEMARFFVIGGECNYMLTTNSEARLVRVSDETLLPLPCTQPLLWEPAEIKRMLDIAESTIKHAVEEMHLRTQIIRKPRSVGVIPGGEQGKLEHPKGHGSLKLKYEALDELAMRVQDALSAADPPVKLPYCAFNGGRDAWIDVGNKAIGMEMMQALLQVPPSKSLHVGDQFLKTGNDIATRSVAPCIWITSPEETTKILEHFCDFRGINVQKLDPNVKQGECEFDVYTGSGIGGP